MTIKYDRYIDMFNTCTKQNKKRVLYIKRKLAP